MSMFILFDALSAVYYAADTAVILPCHLMLILSPAMPMRIRVVVAFYVYPFFFHAC